MRTTITLDEDVAAKLRTAARKSGRPFKEIVNEALRKGLAVDDKAKQLPPFSVAERHLFQLRPGLNYDKIEDVFDELDSPNRLR